MDRIKIGYFLEDRAHEFFIKSAVQKIGQKHFHPKAIDHDVRSATHGSKAIPEYESFIKQAAASGSLPFDILVVAIDGNCHGYNERRKQLLHIAQQENYPCIDGIIFAIPDPHIERWYMMDQKAFTTAVGSSKKPQLPTKKCQKDYYKIHLREAVLAAGLKPFFGGTEFGEEIVGAMNFQRAKVAEPSFDHFHKNLDSCFKRAKAR